MEGSMRTMVNLLPMSFRRQQIVRQRVIQWTSIAGVVLATGWMWHWYERLENVELTQQLDSLQREHAPAQLMLKQLVKMREQLDDLQQQESVAKELEYQRNALTLLSVISDTTKATKGRVRVTKLDLKDFQNLHVPEPGTTENGTGNGLLVSGVSLDNPGVAELFDGLQDSGIFRHVELVVSKERRDGDVALRDYEMRCEF
jgi:Tfp pilus assembly protein PilN